jgi:HD-GYP domain-containing protein (c-di-GMP phosphodiesterase class II)
MPPTGETGAPGAAGVRLAEVVATLSLATDLGSAQPIEHALRTCVLAVRLGDGLGLGPDDLSQTYYLALLRMVGCTADAHVAAAVLGDELAARAWLARADQGSPVHVLGALLRHLGEGNPPLRRARMVASALAGMPRLVALGASHCEVAQRLAARLGFDAALQAALAQVFERWDGRGVPRGLKREQLVLPVRVVQLAQDAVVYHRLGGAEAAVAVARRRAGGAYDPAVVERFCRDAPTLLAELERRSAWETALSLEPAGCPSLSDDRLDDAVHAMADFADLKSPYTAGHSRGVAALAADAAGRCRLPGPDAVALRRAGLLHDLGRVGVSAAVWGKAGPLTDGEWERVRLHPYLTERVLSRSRAFASLARLAALHHERLDGSGYHRGEAAAQQSVAARILAAADVYQAMTEPRPHRPARPPEAAADELRREVRAGRLDGAAVDAVLGAAGHRVGRRRRAWPAGLSEREIEVLRLVARGLSDAQIAGRLTLSRSTVHHHVQHIYDKIGASTRAAAALFAMQHDLMGSAAPLGK